MVTSAPLSTTARVGLPSTQIFTLMETALALTRFTTSISGYPPEDKGPLTPASAEPRPFGSMAVDRLPPDTASLDTSGSCTSQSFDLCATHAHGLPVSVPNADLAESSDSLSVPQLLAPSRSGGANTPARVLPDEPSVAGSSNADALTWKEVAELVTWSGGLRGASTRSTVLAFTSLKDPPTRRLRRPPWVPVVFAQKGSYVLYVQFLCS